MLIDEIISHLSHTRNLKFLREKTDNVSNKLYLFTEGGTTPQYILKGLSPNDFEIDAYSRYLPRIKSAFKTLILPKLIETYKENGITYLLIPYYHGETFDFNTPDINLADQLVEVVKELSSIDVESVIKGGSNFDFKGFETQFWNFFSQAVSLGLINKSLKSRCATLLRSGRTNRKMIIANGDFNPRNVIRLADSKLVLIDWNGIVSPLEHLLTYPWLLNWQNPSWQRRYALQFENNLSIENSRVKMHLMNIALQRAVGEKGHHNQFADYMAENHIKNFNASLTGFGSLTEICG